MLKTRENKKSNNINTTNTVTKGKDLCNFTRDDWEFFEKIFTDPQLYRRAMNTAIKETNYSERKVLLEMVKELIKYCKTTERKSHFPNFLYINTQISTDDPNEDKPIEKIES